MNRFTTVQDGHIHDAMLELEWHRESTHHPHQQAAIDACTALGDDWRAPTVDELASLVDRTRANPTCDPALNMPHDDWHWSSSPVVGWPESAWGVLFGSGLVGYGPRHDSGWVRPVRVARPRQ